MVNFDGPKSDVSKYKLISTLTIAKLEKQLHPFSQSYTHLNTLGYLKLGFVCVSPNFLDKACLAKTRNPQFFGNKSSPNFR